MPESIGDLIALAVSMARQKDGSGGVLIGDLFLELTQQGSTVKGTL